MHKITKRQFDIYDFVAKKQNVGNQEILSFVQKKWGDISRVTLLRDLNFLLASNLIVRQGRGRSVEYSEKIKNPLLKYIDPDNYFSEDSDSRQIFSEKFNFDIFFNIPGFFSKQEQNNLMNLNRQYLKNRKRLTPVLLKKEIERLSIELSWKSSKIEGNTYSLIDTEILIKQQKEATGHKKEEALMILNHKKVLDYIFSRPKEFKKLNLKKIENLHRLIVADMGIAYGIRKGSVGIVGTKYRPLDNQYQIKEALENTIQTINKFKDPFSKALFAILMISYIQSFEDGNKRTARILGNAILLAYDICPLSYRNIDESNYKKAMILFYEQNSARFFKELFIEQYKFAVENYFGG